jgi:hypothetical protein
MAISKFWACLFAPEQGHKQPFSLNSGVQRSLIGRTEGNKRLLWRNSACWWPRTHVTRILVVTAALGRELKSWARVGRRPSHADFLSGGGL